MLRYDKRNKTFGGRPTSARETMSKWLHERADALASQMKMDQSKVVRQIAAENATKSMFRRIRPISKGTQSGAITRVKVPLHTWSYSPPAGLLTRRLNRWRSIHLPNPNHAKTDPVE